MIWTFVKEQRIEEDFSNCKVETAGNGGDYGFYTIKQWYKNNCNNKVATIERKFTTAELPYTHDGVFTSGCMFEGTEVLIAVDSEPENAWFRQCSALPFRERIVLFSELPTFTIV